MLLRDDRVPAEARKFISMNAAIFVALDLVIGLAPGIDNAAHIGGFASGVLLGLVFAGVRVRSGRTSSIPERPENS